MLLLILGIIGWFVCGWWAGSIYRQSNLKAHLGWNRGNEIFQRFLIIYGPFILFGFSLVVALDGSECRSSDPYQCQQYLLYQKRTQSWFGKASDYEKIPHPELSVNL